MDVSLEEADKPPSSWSRSLLLTLRSLKHRHFRVYSIGQVISMSGTAMQNMALAWITYQMTHSAVMLGLVALCTNVPILLLSLPGGALADGHNRRRLILVTQWVEMAVAAVLFLLVLTGSMQVWMIMVLAGVTGTAMAFELPARQAFVNDMVGGDDLVNAVSINSVIYNATRMVGPTIGAVLLANFGQAVCFGLNALSFVAAIATLWMLRSSTLLEKEQEAHADLEHVTMWDGLACVAKNAQMRNLLLLTLGLSFFGLQFTVLLPVFAHEVFEASPHALGWMMAASSVGALVSGLVLASLNKPERLQRNIRVAAMCFPALLLLFALSNVLWMSLFVELFLGVCITVQLTSTNSALQLAAPKELRGRIMGLYTMVVVGMMPFGSLLVGNIADGIGAPWAVTICAIACGASVVLYLLLQPRTKRVEADVRVIGPIKVSVPESRETGRDRLGPQHGRSLMRVS